MLHAQFHDHRTISSVGEVFEGFTIYGCGGHLGHVVVVVLGFYVSPTAKVIWRQDLSLKSHPKD